MPKKTDVFLGPSSTQDLEFENSNEEEGNNTRKPLYYYLTKSRNLLCSHKESYTVDVVVPQ